MVKLPHYQHHRNRNPWSGHMDRWLGKEQAEGIARASRGFRHPIALANVPGCVWAYDGDYIGAIQGGGFASLSDLISEATTGGKKQVFHYNKTQITAHPAVSASQSLWAATTIPVAGANAAGTPGGTIPTNASTGALPVVNAAGGDTLHFISWTGAMSVAQTTALLLYDYLFGVNINHATTANTVSGVPTRYQTATTAPGNFLSGRVTTALGATAHNITVTYVDQDGNAAQAGSAQAIRVSSAVQTIPFTQPKWFYDLSAPDSGLRNVTSIALSAASTGNVDWFIAHAIAILPGTNLANNMFILDGINSAFNLERIYDNACLTFMSWFASATAVGTHYGMITMASG